MHIELLVEEASVEAALEKLLPKLLPAGASYAIHPHQGKPDLLDKLPGRLRGYRSWLPHDWRIVVLIDADEQDCHILKNHLEALAQDLGLSTKSRPGASSCCQVMNRLAIEELEAWFFGDVAAVQAAYPRVGSDLSRKAAYRDPDSIKGGTWEALERELQKRGYYPAGLAKIEAARAIATHMDPQRNRSKSFQVFRDGLQAITAAPPSDVV